MRKQITHLTLVQPMALPNRKVQKKVLTPQEEFEASEQKMKEILKGRGNSPRLKKMSEESMTSGSFEKRLKDLVHDNSED